ncbi:MAG: hypothetical protein ABW022_21570 [Actinoplanes sp.]
MSLPLNDLLQHVLEGEPELGDEVDEVFRRADRLRRRRTQALLGAGAVAVAAIAAGGYLLATTLLRGSEPVAPPVVAHPSPSVWVRPSGMADPVLTVVAPMIDKKGMHIFPRPPERGNGWRQYSVLDSDGRPHGTLEVAVYDVPGELCFPVLTKPGSCARADTTDGVESRRYDDTKDLDWQVHQSIARRISDGRTIVVMVTGERGTNDEARGRPALTGAQVEQSATDDRMFAAFTADEACDRGSVSDCPAFRVPVPAP